MRVLPSSISPLAAAVLFAAAATRPANAQQAAAPAPARPIVAPAAEQAAPVDTAPRTVAVYRFAAPRSTGMPELVTVTDSAGRITAS